MAQPDPKPASVGNEPISQLLEAHPNLQPLLDVKLPVIAILAEKSMHLSGVLELDVGSVVVFPKNDSAPITLRVKSN